MRIPIRFVAGAFFIITLLTGTSLASSCYSLTLLWPQTPQSTQAAGKPAPAINQPTGDQQKALKELFTAADRATTEAQIAQKTAEGARQKFFAELYRIMAELGLKPSEYSISFADNGEVKFEKHQASKAEMKPQEAKP